MELERNFDVVVMLTWSDWHRDPRSNRYHYATRFARERPVIFVQPDLREDEDPGRGYATEKIEGHDITILHVRDDYGRRQTAALTEALYRLGVRAPLLWIYNVFFEHFILRSPAPLKIYHGTESYLSPTQSVAIAGEGVHAPMRRVLAAIDLLVCVSEGVASDYRRTAPMRGRALPFPTAATSISGATAAPRTMLRRKQRRRWRSSRAA